MRSYWVSTSRCAVSKIFLILYVGALSNDIRAAFPFPSMEECAAAISSGSVIMPKDAAEDAIVIRQCVYAETIETEYGTRIVCAKECRHSFFVKGAP